jgi:hypothetical protein
LHFLPATMFCSTAMTLGLLLGTALSSPPSDAGPELRGPRWQGRAAAVVHVETATELRDPFGGRGGVAAEHVQADGSLRDPFDARRAVPVVVDDGPIAPASRPRSKAATPIPAARPSDVELNDPFARKRVGRIAP